MGNFFSSEEVFFGHHIGIHRELFDNQDLKKKDKNHLHLVGTLFAFCIQLIFRKILIVEAPIRGVL